MGIEYIAAISKYHCKSFKMVLTTTLPRDYEMWLRVRDRGKLKALNERGVIVTEIKVSPMEFGVYCRGLKGPDFSIAITGSLRPRQSYRRGENCGRGVRTIAAVASTVRHIGTGKTV
jgi:hypothetical protein